MGWLSHNQYFTSHVERRRLTLRIITKARKNIGSNRSKKRSVPPVKKLFNFNYFDLRWFVHFSCNYLSLYHCIDGAPWVTGSMKQRKIPLSPSLTFLAELFQMARILGFPFSQTHEHKSYLPIWHLYDVSFSYCYIEIYCPG